MGSHLPLFLRKRNDENIETSIKISLLIQNTKLFIISSMNFMFSRGCIFSGSTWCTLFSSQSYSCRCYSFYCSSKQKKEKGKLNLHLPIQRKRLWQWQRRVEKIKKSKDKAFLVLHRIFLLVELLGFLKSNHSCYLFTNWISHFNV